jgi:hypothetical protein
MLNGNGAVCTCGWKGKDAEQLSLWLAGTAVAAERSDSLQGGQAMLLLHYPQTWTACEVQRRRNI